MCDTGIIGPYPAQPVVEMRTHAFPNWTSVLVECGEPFGKTLPEAGPGYQETAVSLGGGFHTLPDENETVQFDAARLLFMDGVMVSAGGGTGIECHTGGTLGAGRVTGAALYHSCLSGFDTDVKRDTSGSWEAQSIRNVVALGYLAPGIRYSGEVEVWGYTDSNTLERKATLYPDTSVDLVETSVDHEFLILVVVGNAEPVYASVYDGAPPVIPIYVNLRPSGSSTAHTLWISTPPNIRVASGDHTALIVGENGETFWSGDHSPDETGFTLSGISEDTLASEWVEMWMRGTSFRRTAGTISVDPSFSFGGNTQ